MDAYQQIARNIEAGKYDPKYHHDMRVQQRGDERARVIGLFANDLLGTYERMGVGRSATDLFDLAWEVYQDLGYSAVLDGFHRMLTTT